MSPDLAAARRPCIVWDVGEQALDAKKQFGRYVLGPELGSGGMAIVSFAMATGALGFSRPVAIKRIHPMLARDEDLRGSIRDEARIAARVRHPNVVSVLDIVDDADSVGLVLEYVHGEVLSALLRSSAARDTPVPIGVAVAIIIDVLHGLHAAHTAVDDKGVALGIVHRDVSPQNVIVGADGVSRVLDFGISKAEHRASVTRDGQVKGKLRYMAPEQLGGEAAPSVDIYAAGLLLWEALTGRSPFGDVVEGAHLIASVLTGVSAVPSTLRSDISPSLDALVSKALQTVPTRRFASALEMAQALEDTGLSSSRSAVAAYVQELAGESLAARGKIVALLEQGMPADDLTRPPQAEKSSNEAIVLASVDPAPSRGRRWQWGVLGGALLGLTTVALAMWLRDPRVRPSRPDVPVPFASLAQAPPERTAAQASAGAASVSPLTAPIPSASSIPSSAPAGRPMAKPKRIAPDCSIPYTVDANGYRAYRRECFQQP
jgi:eukaryotic-like serine/threonine-protein kinase